MKAAVMGVALLLAAGVAQAGDRLTPAQIAERVRPSMVLIKSGVGQATGFVVAADGRIVTTLRALVQGHGTTVVLADGREVKDLQVTSANPRHGLVVLRLPVQDLPPLALGDSAKVKPGQAVVAIGHPRTILEGQINEVRTIEPRVRLLAVSAPISPESSGGPLFDDRGELIGISTIAEKDQQQLAYGIPVNALKPMLVDDMAQPLASWLSPPTPAPRVEPQRVPHHDLAILEGCSSGQARRIVIIIDAAIDEGAPLYNKGRPQACHEVYVTAARAIERGVSGCPGPKQALREGISRASSGSWDARAWAMRHTFDGLVNVINRREAAGERNVPRYDSSLLDGCSHIDAGLVTLVLTNAIDTGAPLYDQGNAQACFYVYEAAIKKLQSELTSCQGPRNALQAGLRKAAAQQGWEKKAFALRDAFEGILIVTRTAKE